MPCRDWLSDPQIDIEVDAPKPADKPLVVRQGWLVKRGDRFRKAWTDRYVVLTEKSLAYFAKADDFTVSFLIILCLWGSCAFAETQRGIGRRIVSIFVLC